MIDSFKSNRDPTRPALNVSSVWRLPSDEGPCMLTEISKLILYSVLGMATDEKDQSLTYLENNPDVYKRGHQ